MLLISVKFQEYKSNIQVSVAFLYIKHKLSGKKEMKKTIIFITTSKRIKYLRMNLTKEVKDLYIENYKTLREEIEEDTPEWKNSVCSQIATAVCLSHVWIFLTL